MRVESRMVRGATPGVTYEVVFLHFGKEGARPKIYVQAGLHADEAPGQLTAHHLRERLIALEAQGLVRGHIVLVPVANPIGLSQQVLGTLQGRFALADGVNFNRNFPELAADAALILKDKLTDDAERNGSMIREALRDALSAWKPSRAPENLKKLLLSEAIDADVVLDLHCDGEAEVHLYTPTEQADAFRPLAAYLSAKALLFANVSGDHPFDEAVSRPWSELRQRFPDFPIPEGSIATTVELRGEGDVRHANAAKDAEAIIQFLALRRAIDLVPAPLPDALCKPTPLAGSEALEAPASGVIVFARQTGDEITIGSLIAEIIDPVSGSTTPVHATTSGIFYARTSARFAVVGKRLGKVAGANPFRSGNLLSP
jgi:uncharacterized protein